MERLNILNDDSDNPPDLEYTPLTPTFQEVFPSPSTNNYDAIPTLNSIQSLPSPSVEVQEVPNPSTAEATLSKASAQDLTPPIPSTSKATKVPITLSKRKKITVVAKTIKNLGLN